MMPTATFRVVTWICLASGPLWVATQASGQRAAVERFRDVVYVQRESGPLVADVFVPKVDHAVPGVLVVHGGAWLSGSKSQLGAVAYRLAQRGYVAVSINYRLAPKYKFPAQLDDCRAALTWMQRSGDRYRIDPDRLAAYGYSAGAQLVALLAMTEAPKGESTPRLRAIVAGGTPSDFREMPLDDKTLAYWLGGTRREVPFVYREASPAAYVSADAPPTFLFHGAKDWMVVVDQARQLHKALEDANVATELHILPESGHIETFFDVEACYLAIDFLDRYLHPLEASKLSAETLPTRNHSIEQ